MPNTHFQFKQFIIQQANCAMKVCTDSCILGAYTQVSDNQRVMDIGTGTGLLALMLAQRVQAQIYAIEIDLGAYQQAVENVANSPWAKQIKVYRQAIQDFARQFPEVQYDLIITNPPFFKNNWKSSNIAKNLAMHSESLSFADLLAVVRQFLSPKGSFWVLLPEYEAEVLAKKALQYDLQTQQKLLIYNRPETPVFRVIQELKFTEQILANQVISKELFIRDKQNEYTPEFRELLKDYYLIF
jgi:tRNA1Val (adenine37-N6)-methyltransferase